MIVRWQAFDDSFQRMEALSHQMNEIFSEITSTTSTAETLWNPPIELVDTPDNLLLRVQLPGVDRDKLDIQIEYKYLYTRTGLTQFSSLIPVGSGASKPK
ncbi:MAG: hypothetical protein GDA43_20880 [Hormoscilla sp. SP5CHS1]|nr:hypothetical protein [Hormoscilla sp. SP5CHS1]